MGCTVKNNFSFCDPLRFEVGDTPGVGTFYDFFKRLWDSESNILSPHLHPLKKKKVNKPKQNGTKAESIEIITVAQLFSSLQASDFRLDDQPYASLFKIYHQEFLNTSAQKGLINPSSLAVAGDGTPVVSSARERKHHICDCMAKGISDCKCSRFFSQPDCDIGWDSSRDCFYHGYGLYMLVASDSASDLPVFPLLNPASKHDSHGFLETFFRMKAFRLSCLPLNNRKGYFTTFVTNVGITYWTLYQFCYLLQSKMSVVVLIVKVEAQAASGYFWY